MKVIVAVKRLVDYQVKIRVKSDGSGIETDNVKMSMNPFDEIALEEAIRLKEQGHTSEVVVVTLGDNACQETLRHALALGADRAILIQVDEALAPLQVAKLLKALSERESPQLFMLGKQAIDNDCNQVGQMLAGLLGWPQATYASKVSVTENQAEVVREVDGGLEAIRVTLPAVITADLRLNEPRFASLPNIMKSKAKPIETLSVDSLGGCPASSLQVVSVEAPKSRTCGIKVDSIGELMTILKDKEELLP